VDDMVHNVMTVQKLLEERDQGEGINFLELVMNPDDYGQTVENIFYASFLIKEGSAGIQVDEDGQIVIRMSAEWGLKERKLISQVMKAINRWKKLAMSQKTKQ
jgi:hypothetical protein